MRRSSRFLAVVVGLSLVTLALLLGGCGSQKASYPTKAVELVVPYSAGGGTDLDARAFATVAGNLIGFPVRVNNQPAGGGADGSRAVANAAPDGYTLGFGTTGSYMTVPMISGEKEVGYSYESFEPIAILAQPSFFVVTNVDSQWKTMKDLVDYMKANSGKVTYANSGIGGSAQFFAELLAMKMGFKWRPVPFNGSAPADQAVLTGSVDVGVPSTGSAMSLLGSGKLRPLAVSAPKRVGTQPDVPTIKEALGLDYSFTIYRILYGPLKTPQNVLETWESTAKKSLEDKSLQDQLTKIEGEPPVFEGRADVLKRIKTEYADMKPVADAIKVSSR